jgi:hypothetical protein
MSFGGILKQSTAVNVIIGPFVDSTNGDDEETGLTIAQADVRLSKNAGADAQKNDNTSAAHEGDGFYMCELDATDTNTVGQLTLWVHVAGALAVRHDYQIIEEAVYDALFGASALGYVANAPVNVAQFGGSNGTFASGIPAVNAVQISGDSTAADNLENAYDDAPGAVPWHGIVDQGTTQSITGTGAVLRSAAAFPNDVLIGMVFSVLFNGSWQHRIITDNALSGDTITFDALAETPTGTLPYKIWGAPPASAPVTTALTDIQSRLPAALVSGRIDASVGAMAAGVVTAAAVATDAIDADALADGAITAATFAASAIDATAIASNAITAAKIAADAITAAKIADGAIDAATFAAGAINAAAIASDAITDAKVASDVTIASVTGAVGSVASGGITAASFGANAINAAKLDPDVTTELQIGLATASALATVAGFLDTEIAAILALLDDPRTEPGQGAPPVNPDLATKIDYLYKAWRNKKDNNGTETKLYADDGSTVDHKQTTSESGGTVTKGEWATGA